MRLFGCVINIGLAGKKFSMILSIVFRLYIQGTLKFSHDNKANHWHQICLHHWFTSSVFLFTTISNSFLASRTLAFVSACQAFTLWRVNRCPPAHTYAKLRTLMERSGHWHRPRAYEGKDGHCFDADIIFSHLSCFPAKILTGGWVLTILMDDVNNTTRTAVVCGSHDRSAGPFKSQITNSNTLTFWDEMKKPQACHLFQITRLQVLVARTQVPYISVNQPKSIEVRFM